MDYNLRLTALREKQGLSQRQVAASIGVCPATVAQWELGMKGIRAKNMVALTRLLHCTIDELVEIKPTEPMAG